MYGYSDIKKAGNTFSTNFQGLITDNLPTLEKRLDRYFYENFESIIDEWGLLVENDLLELERRLNKAITSLAELERGHLKIRDDMSEIEKMISELEGDYGN